jgi:hypothetical protein
MSWFSSNVLDPIEDVGSAVIHGDITGGKYQASASDWGKTALDVAAVVAPFIAGPALGALAIGGDVAAGGADIAATGVADAASAAPTLDSAYGLTAGSSGLDVSAPTAAAALTPASTLDPTVAGAYASADTASAAAPLNIVPQGASAPASLDSLAYGGSQGASGYGGGAGSPLSLASTGPGTTPSAGSSILDTLTSPSKWTLPGVAQGVGAGVAGVGLAANLAKKNATSANQQNVANVAGAAQQQFQQLTAESSQLRSYLENGSLPPALQAQVDQQVKAYKATLIANAAKNGASTDPTQNTALAQDLAAADRNGLILAGNLETQLFQQGQAMLSSGLGALGLSGQLYTTLANMDRTDQAQLEQAINVFAGSLNSSKGINLSLGK